MKKKVLIAMSVLTMSVFAATGCSGKTGSAQPSETQQTEEQAAVDAQDSEQSTICGTLDERKDFMFVITDDDQTSYALTYEEMPEGLDRVKIGDRIKVTYTGTLSEIDPFTGEVLSVEKQ